MDNQTAADIMSQLGNGTRLEITRLLVRAGKNGLRVGELQQKLDIPASTLSHHINALKSVKLISQERQSNLLVCRVNYPVIDSIVAFLTAECCAGVD